MRRWMIAACLALMPAAGSAMEISVTQWGNSLTGLPYAVALESHMFQKAGIDVTGIIGSGGGGTTVRNMLASPLPYGEVSLAAALAAARQGLDVVIVNVGSLSLPESSVVTRPESTVKSIADLAGKRVAITSPRGVSDMVLQMALKANGLDLSATTRVVAGGYGQGLVMLDHDAVDAASLIEPLSIMRRDRYRTVFEATDILPPMVTLVGITTRQYARAHQQEIRALIAGRREAVRWIYANPVAVEPILARSFKVEPAVAHEAAARMIKFHMWSEGNFVPVELDRFAEGLKLVGEIEKLPDWSTIIDTVYLPADLQAKP